MYIHVYTCTWFGVWCLWWFHYPGLLLYTVLMVSPVHTITSGHRTISDQYMHVTDYSRHQKKVVCAIMVGQNVRARDNACIINYMYMYMYIAYCVLHCAVCADNYFTLGACMACVHPATLFIPSARRSSMGATTWFL